MKKQAELPHRAVRQLGSRGFGTGITALGIRLYAVSPSAAAGRRPEAAIAWAGVLPTGIWPPAFQPRLHRAGTPANMRPRM
jgi:hypothetical protein